jgi:hypothetical protein
MISAASVQPARKCDKQKGNSKRQYMLHYTQGYFPTCERDIEREKTTIIK